STAATAPPQRPPADPLISIKHAIPAATLALLKDKLGRDPQNEEVIAAIGEIAAAVPNQSGTRGEVLMTLRNCTDGVWLKNILKELDRQIQHTAMLMAMDLHQTAAQAPAEPEQPEGWEGPNAGQPEGWNDPAGIPFGT